MDRRPVPSHGALVTGGPHVLLWPPLGGVAHAAGPLRPELLLRGRHALVRALPHARPPRHRHRGRPAGLPRPSDRVDGAHLMPAVELPQGAHAPALRHLGPREQHAHDPLHAEHRCVALADLLGRGAQRGLHRRRGRRPVHLLGEQAGRRLHEQSGGREVDCGRLRDGLQGVAAHRPQPPRGALRRPRHPAGLRQGREELLLLCDRAHRGGAAAADRLCRRAAARVCHGGGEGRGRQRDRVKAQAVGSSRALSTLLLPPFTGSSSP
mmetsp:Transcript_30727/g.78414  ORF Transcript_30727/g.78414 Transcript_30727/m.78414 type:complete len:266 (-) Transcript_30727:289-1086(-)